MWMARYYEIGTAAAVVAAVASVLWAVPAEAHYNGRTPHLTAGEACRIAGKAVHREYTNVVPGSGSCFTQRRPGHHDQRLVDFYYEDRAGSLWLTTLSVRETWTQYRWRILNDSRVE
jgi:hypothetical protein